jgi:hypothetical protein
MKSNRAEQCSYHIQLLGSTNLDELNPGSPLLMTPVRSEPGVTAFTIRGDQSGLIGLLRHLHNLGLTLLSISREA